jgi:hypothetical protein
MSRSNKRCQFSILFAIAVIGIPPFSQIFFIRAVFEMYQVNAPTKVTRQQLPGRVYRQNANSLYFCWGEITKQTVQKKKR